MSSFLAFAFKAEFYIVLFLVLLSKSVYYEALGENYLLIPFLFFICVKLCFVGPSTVKVPILLIFYSACLVFIVCINFESRLSSLLVLMTRVCIAIVVVGLVSFTLFSVYFSKIIYLLSIASLFSFPVIFFDIPSFLPDFIAMDGRVLRNFILFSVWEGFISHQIFRNSGIWWEPGAFAVFVNLAFLFDIINKRINFVRFFIYAVTVLSTYSTAGFIVFLLLLLLLLNGSRVKSFAVASIAFAPAFAAVFFLIIIPNVIHKFDVANYSLLSRYYDLLISIEMFISNPLLGYGFGSQIENAVPFGIELLGAELYNNASPTGADGLTMFIAQVGIVGFFLLIPFLFPRYICGLGLVCRILIAAALFVMFNTQNFTFIIIFLVLTYYGMVGVNNSLKEWRV